MNKAEKMSQGTIVIPSQKTSSILDILVSICYFDFSHFSKKRVAILRLNGIIGKASGLGSKGMSLESMNSQIEKAFKYSRLEAVMLIINSPGGSPVQSELIASRIISLSKEKKVPVYSFVEDVAASGGYWLACAGDNIYASKSSIIGSVGVISAGFGLNEAIAKLGIERRIYTSGKNKSVLDPFSPTKQSDIKLIQKIQTSVHKHFIDYVKSRRNGRLTQDDDVLFNGEFWTGEVANDFGLIDGIDDVYNFIRRNFGPKTKIEYVVIKESWFKKQLGIFARFITRNFVSEVKTSLSQAEIESKYNLN
ncbi:MAG: S49 family peptidase [Rickettsiaceae bacterium]|nr:S49 family peptidase [Rickettsiaceae bacterium]